ncbi:MAG: nitrogenase cofactor biosynthesis protein NifB [Candidatus Dactylopiibacterium carminicum]|uniref:FeMo cofactor biosynthesis protein NifB n=1 Tax=Candidatus Dactylopiibacterium carminicum TaxID=857335 RepID=A0A272EW02_9RHOO|nr:nitrogenase cofactor biosynthesis protein NifB [Candidatus Dactylopiibacterium carminicum]KAF7599521.1 nitrogenase cofactor biosynthesis protein NifB [Candidatus Dactylopiibacterium carminicum]PAS94285.1 MAG: nitrogenase cofactor biosynthesis protein NifB [Candidatus Dactylopiibacterium carminicum]PAS99527.1 MAG: nitrogenase cofactor biosynthesis protein NifB [Candidatus Dactylopiibacterium carminicum]
MSASILGSPLSAGGCSSARCGAATSQTDQLPASLQQRFQDHPCYSEEAHQYFARIHVAVAPACNIQCNYCNRKYDCSNESRPGVVSEVLTPEQAVKKTLIVAAEIPQMSVLGIAGPGDALANPGRTFEVFRELSRRAPDIKLCLSTNGLMLPQYVDEIAAANIDHVTITINCLDPEIGARIYPWIFWNHRRVQGREAAEILIAQQQKGLEMLVARGILVKVNSVMIPGINDEHLKEVSRVVRAKGAFLHNVMPLISEAEHGTHFGLTGQRGPTPEELKNLQDACAGEMSMMRHCRQCRADAVGMLGEDRGSEFSLARIDALQIDEAFEQAARQRRAEVREAIHAELEAKRATRHGGKAEVLSFTPLARGRPVQMAVASSGSGVINQHFGHAREFLIYEASSKGVRFLGTRRAAQYCGGEVECGEHEADNTLARTIAILADCEVILCSRIGIEPWRKLEEAGIRPDTEHAMESIEGSVFAVWRQMLESGRLDVAPFADQMRA